MHLKNFNKNRRCYYLDDIININNLNHKKSYGEFSIYDVAHKTPFGAMPLLMDFHKVDGYIRKYYGTKYLALILSDEKCERSFAIIKYNHFATMQYFRR